MTDRRAPWDVSARVSRRFAGRLAATLCTVGALALVSGAGLGGCSKNKAAATTPAAGGGAAGGGGQASAGGPGGGGGGPAGEGGGEGGAGAGGEDGSGQAAGGGPAVQPPTLDLAPAEKQRRVNQALKQGWSALDGAGDPDLAIKSAKDALSVDETSVPAMVLLARADYVKGYYDQVQDVLDKAMQRGGDKYKQIHFLQGLIDDKNKQPDKALDEYNKAVQLDPNYRSALMNLGVHLLDAKRYDEAVTLYERLTGQLGYRNAAAFTNLGSAYRGQSAEFTTTDVNRRNGLLLKAEEAYKRAVDANKNYSNAYYDLGLLYLDADPFPQGKDDMDKIQRLQRAKTYFDEYRRLPGADQKLVDDQVSVAEKLIEKEQRIRKKAAEREAKRRAREAKDKANGNGGKP